ncbi:hypothetical protein M0R19_02990 [Candidatus Pacearchaeota archaeon]|nr:hypothetical protein [Candidatus Pacearchaeota archaeon]
MIANQPAINNISYSDSPKIEFRIENSVLNQYQNLSLDKALDEITKSAVLNPFYFLNNKSNIGYQIVKESQDSDLITENIKKSIQFRKPTDYEIEQARDKVLFKEPKPYFQIPFFKIKF